MSEFANWCEEAATAKGTKKTYSAKYYMSKEKGVGSAPGRELLEAAAAVAGLDFEDCIRLPIDLPVEEMKQRYLEIFTAALNDWRSQHAIRAAFDLASLKPPPRKKKTGGRIRKH